MVCITIDASKTSNIRDAGSKTLCYETVIENFATFHHLIYYPALYYNWLNLIMSIPFNLISLSIAIYP